KLDALFAATARSAVEGGICRLVVAGGETSGAVVSALGLDALAIGPEIDPGVPALATTAGQPLALALKSGNFGAENFFEKALSIMGDAA
ncbi:MAG TPA: nucleotide-binding domain containing protein, partial [Beijerinckiaceae bacterium]|nr:nucleotide-binding domain containing protein [Beijerinckiaceae bacterium]